MKTSECGQSDVEYRPVQRRAHRCLGVVTLRVPGSLRGAWGRGCSALHTGSELAPGLTEVWAALSNTVAPGHMLLFKFQ